MHTGKFSSASKIYHLKLHSEFQICKALLRFMITSPAELIDTIGSRFRFKLLGDKYSLEIKRFIGVTLSEEAESSEWLCECHTCVFITVMWCSKKQKNIT